MSLRPRGLIHGLFMTSHIFFDIKARAPRVILDTWCILWTSLAALNQNGVSSKVFKLFLFRSAHQRIGGTLIDHQSGSKVDKVVKFTLQIFKMVAVFVQIQIKLWSLFFWVSKSTNVSKFVPDTSTRHFGKQERELHFISIAFLWFAF